MRAPSSKPTPRASGGLRRSTATATDPTAPTFFGFTSSGSFAVRERQVHRETTAAVRVLLFERKTLSPSELAVRIRSLKHNRAFPMAVCGFWDKFGEFIYWQHVDCATQAESFIKYHGMAGAERCQWIDGRYVQRPEDSDEEDDESQMRPIAPIIAGMELKTIGPLGYDPNQETT